MRASSIFSFLLLSTPLQPSWGESAAAGESTLGALLPGSFFLNELGYDTSGDDDYIEVAGHAGDSLDGWRVMLYTKGGVPYEEIVLEGTLPDEGSGFGAKSFSKGGKRAEAGDGLALINPEGKVTEFLSYESELTALEGAAAGYTSTGIHLNAGGRETAGTSAGSGGKRAGWSLQLVGTGHVSDHFRWEARPASMGKVNAGQQLKSQVFINEVHFAATATGGDGGDGGDNGDHSDNNEGVEHDFVEVAAPSGTSLSGWRLMLYSSVGVPFSEVLLDGTVPDEGFGYGTLHFEDIGLRESTSGGVALITPTGKVAQFLSCDAQPLSATEGLAAGKVATRICTSDTEAQRAGFSMQLVSTCAEETAPRWEAKPASRGVVNPGQQLDCTESEDDAAGGAAPAADDNDDGGDRHDSARGLKDEM